MARMRMGPLGFSFDSDILWGVTESATLWDETGRTAISLIVVSFDQCSARSIQFGFIENGGLVMSKTYGSSSDCSRRVIRLNHETEFVTEISGEKVCPPKKLEFHSGIPDRREFEGFFGLFDDDQLISINFNARHILPDVKTIEKEKD